MDEKRPISKNALFDIFKNNNEAALRSPTPSHLLNRSGNSAFRVPPLGSTPVNYSLHPRTEHLFLHQPFYNTLANNYGPEESFPSSVVTTSTNSSISNFSPIRPLPMRGTSPQLHYALDSFNVNRPAFIDNTRLILSVNNNDSPKNIDDTSLIKDSNSSMAQDEEIKVVSFNDKDLESINNQHDFRLIDKGKKAVQESKSNQIEQASEDENCSELTKWHLRVISIQDMFIPEISERVDCWVVLSGVIKGTCNNWHSSVVIVREHSRLVQTIKDKSYLLIGKLAAKKMEADGFSEGLIKAFEDGFPENWRELLFAELGSSDENKEISPKSSSHEENSLHEISLSFKESHIHKRFSLREENSSQENNTRKKHSLRKESIPQGGLNNSLEESVPQKEFNLHRKRGNFLEENIPQNEFREQSNSSEIGPLEGSTSHDEVSPLGHEEQNNSSEIGPPLEENISHAEVSPLDREEQSNGSEIGPLEKRITPRLKSKGSSNEKRSKTPVVQKQGEIVTSSGRRIRAPGNWWEVNPEPSVKEEKVEPKRRRLSSIGKRISSSTIEKHTPSSTTVKPTPSSNIAKKRGRRRKLRSSQKGHNVRDASRAVNTNETNTEANAEETTVDVPRHEVYVLVETK